MQANTSNRDTLVRVPVDLHRRLKIKAAQEGSSIRSLLKRLLEEWLAKQRKAA